MRVTARGSVARIVRLPAVLAADGPDYLDLRKAGRAAIVAPAVLAVGKFGLHDDSLATYAVFAAIVALVFADYGGPPRRRAGAYLTMIVLGSAVILLGAALSSRPVAAVAGMFVVAFLAAFASAFGGYTSLHVSAVALGYSLSVLQPLSQLSVADRVAGWALGGTAALGAGLVLWPVDRRTGLRQAAADLMGQLARVVAPADRAASPAPLATAEAMASDLQARLSTPLRPFGPSARDVAMAHLVEHLEHAVRLAAAVPAALPAEGDDRLGHEVAAALERSRQVLAGRRAPTVAVDGLAPLDAARAAGRARVEDTALRCSGEDGGAGAVRAMAGAIPLLALSHLVLWIEFESARAVAAGAAPAGPALPTAPEMARTPGSGLRSVAGRGRAFVAAELDPGGVILRNSLRLGLALAAAVALAETLGVEHGFWIVLATLLVLRSNAASTSASALAAVLGTVAGFAMVVVILEVAGDSTAVLWALYPVAVAASAFTPGALGVAVGQATFAVQVVLLFALVDLPGFPTAVVRLETVTVGAVTAVALSLMMWPRGARALLAGAVGEVFRAAAAGAGTFVTGSAAARSAAEHRVNASYRRAEAALASALAEHGEPIDLAAWTVVVQPLVLTRALLVGLVPTVRSPVPACRAAVDTTTRTAATARRRLSGVADRLRVGAQRRAPDGAGADGAAHDPGVPNPALDACVDACAGHRDRMVDALALTAWSIFLRELIDDMDRAAGDVAAVAEASAPGRWFS